MSTLPSSIGRPLVTRVRAVAVAVALVGVTLGSAASPAPVAAWTDGATSLRLFQPYDLTTQLPATAGTPFFLKVTAYAGNEYRRFFTDGVHFTSTDPAATLPADYGFSCTMPYTVWCDDDGGHLFAFTFRTPGSRTLTVTDVSAPSITGSITFDVLPGAAMSMALSNLPANTVKGATSNVKVTMRDASGNVATGYTGTVHVTATDGTATLPADYAFTPADAGVAYLPVACNATGSQSVTVVDVANGLLHASASTTVAAAPHLVLDLGDTNAWAGSMIWGVLSAAKADSTTDAAYRGTVRFTSSDPTAALPGDFTFTAQQAGYDSTVLQDVVFHRAGTQTLTVTDIANPAITGTVTVNVRGGSVATMQLRWLPGGTTAGTPMRAGVFGWDAWGNPAQGTWKVHLLSSDPAAVLPADYTLHVADGGQHAFDVALRTAGSRTIRAEVVGHLSINDVETVLVLPAPAAALSVGGMPTVLAVGAPGAVTVRAADAYGNAVSVYTGTVHLTSSDPAAVLPVDYTFAGQDNGARGLLVTLNTAGIQSITATDTVTASMTGSQTGISVYATDSTPPTVSVPTVTLRTGVALAGSAIPVAVTWTGSDAGSGIDHYRLERSGDGGTTWATVAASVSSPSVMTTMPSSGTVRFRAIAWDHAGLSRTGAASATLTPRIVQQSTAIRTWSTAWRSTSSSVWSGGSARYSKTARTSASYTFTAKRVALVMAKGPTRGKVKVYVNGAYVTTLNLYASPATTYRVVIWQKAWSTSARRTVKLVVVGTAGHPRVDVDAFVTVR